MSSYCLWQQRVKISKGFMLNFTVCRSTNFNSFWSSCSSSSSKLVLGILKQRNHFYGTQTENDVTRNSGINYEIRVLFKNHLGSFKKHIFPQHLKNHLFRLTCKLPSQERRNLREHLNGYHRSIHTVEWQKSLHALRTKRND